MDNRLYKQLFAHPYEALQVADSPARHYICLLFALRDACGGLPFDHASQTRSDHRLMSGMLAN